MIGSELHLNFILHTGLLISDGEYVSLLQNEPQDAACLCQMGLEITRKNLGV